MEPLSVIHDNRINADNILVELSIGEYLEIAARILDKNPFQRRRVRSAVTVYNLLKQDLQKGCTMPSLILAIAEQTIDRDKLAEFISNNPAQVMILDGLQRTYTMLDLQKELSEQSEELSKFLSNVMRMEVYVGIDKLGILYRMLTLNSGQTPMTLRHQIEILYADYLDRSIDGIILLRESDERYANVYGKYKFREIMEGFNAYIERSELPFDRFDILENIKSLESLSKENQDRNLFFDYVKTFHALILKFRELADGWKFNEDDFEERPLGGPPFGTEVYNIFTKSQVITGYGSAIGKLVDHKLLSGFHNLTSSLISGIKFETTPQEGKV